VKYERESKKFVGRREDGGRFGGGRRITSITVRWTLPHGRCCAVFPGSLPQDAAVLAIVIVQLEHGEVLFCRQRGSVSSCISPHRRFQMSISAANSFRGRSFSQAHRQRFVPSALLLPCRCLSHLSISRRTTGFVAVNAPSRNAAATNHMATPCKRARHGKLCTLPPNFRKRAPKGKADFACSHILRVLCD
jgi:hypothetical protein